MEGARRSSFPRHAHAISPSPEQRGHSYWQPGPVPGLLLGFFSLSALITFKIFLNTPSTFALILTPSSLVKTLTRSPVKFFSLRSDKIFSLNVF